MPDDQFGKALAGGLWPASRLQGFHVNRDAGVSFSGAHGRRGVSS